MFGLTRAPELQRPGQIWFNVAAPVRLSDLRGRVVVLDFWTFCCVNCHHVLPTLRRIEDRFPREVAVIGVHSPKFDAERCPEALAKAIARLDVRHPVVHDPDRRLWTDYAVRAWPTLVLLSPDGHVIGQLSGEPDPDRMLDGLACMIRGFMEQGDLRPGALPLRTPPPPAGRLRFPGKLAPLAAPTAEGAVWALADSGHHQIVLLSAEGAEVRRLGSGAAGLEDGPAGSAAFRDPQGLCAAPDGALWVADTGNHALRRVDIAGEGGAGGEGDRVCTVAGNGGRGLPLGEPEAAARAMLASPWDVATDGRRVYLANAGTHQILAWDGDTDTLRPIAGTGGESIVDGPGDHALLAQPSGLALDAAAGMLWFADAETSAIRGLGLADGRVCTLVGRGLFDFGFADGPLAEASLQHPLALALLEDGSLIVADSYNNALRRLDRVTGSLTTLPLDQPLAEPAGVRAAGRDRLLVSDTNSHRILEVTPSTGGVRVWLA
jgi:streptogramin lyase/thiol-disulfide isomerase/thioredoxin